MLLDPHSTQDGPPGSDPAPMSQHQGDPGLCARGLPPARAPGVVLSRPPACPSSRGPAWPPGPGHPGGQQGLSGWPSLQAQPAEAQAAFPSSQRAGDSVSSRSRFLPTVGVSRVPVPGGPPAPSQRQALTRSITHAQSCRGQRFVTAEADGSPSGCLCVPLCSGSRSPTAGCWGRERQGQGSWEWSPAQARDPPVPPLQASHPQ